MIDQTWVSELFVRGLYKHSLLERASLLSLTYESKNLVARAIILKLWSLIGEFDDDVDSENNYLNYLQKNYRQC
mgnify:CR=1 FL=1